MAELNKSLDKGDLSSSTTSKSTTTVANSAAVEAVGRKKMDRGQIPSPPETTVAGSGFGGFRMVKEDGGKTIRLYTT